MKCFIDYEIFLAYNLFMEVFNLNERIRLLRRSLNLTQQEFAERIGMKQNSIALIESGKRNISDQALLSICREFGVNEEWLRHDTGEMLVPDPGSELAALADKYNLSAADQVLIDKYVSLKPGARETIMNFITDVASALDGPDHTYSDIPDTPEELESKYPVFDLPNDKNRVG